VVLSKILSLGEGKDRRRCEAIVKPTNDLKDQMSKLPDEELRGLTQRYRKRVADGEDLDDLMPEAFATVREAAWRVRGQRHFDVQLMGGAALHYGYIAEMKTGEGKTLTATLPAYLNALTGEGVHVVTVNDYLAKRDAEWMGAIYRFLGLSVGVILTTMTPAQRWPQYTADITHGTNNEFGFDYLRDNMALSAQELVQRGHAYAIVDEVDSILIDEARTPLIISGPAEQGASEYERFAGIAPKLERGLHYEVDEGKHTCAITEKGIEAVESMLGVENLYDVHHTPLVHHLQNAIRAKELYRKDVHYLVRDGEVLIVDEFTGRVMEGRRYSEGLHQAIEAKEHVRIKEENQTYASITLQNYFRMYDKLAGMTGTARTEAAEFSHIYKLSVVEIPTNAPMIRKDHPDDIYKREQSKFDSLVAEVVQRNDGGKGQPVLIGTVSIEKSEKVSSLLKSKGIKHNVLNAKHHEQEARIIAQAGQPGAVTVATNMAGRGVDIMLGGNVEYLAEEMLRRAGMEIGKTPPEEWNRAWRAAIEEKTRRVATDREWVIAKGGLAVIGTERHESRRIDNQLRGRSGRQGDPGESKFFLSLEDDLMRMFATKSAASLMERFSMPDDVPITHKLTTRAIANAQRQVESRNFEIRKDVLKYDEVLNKQREVVYQIRRRILEGEDPTDRVRTMLDNVVSRLVDEHAPPGTYPEEWDLRGFFQAMSGIFRRLPAEISRALLDYDNLEREEFKHIVLDVAERAHQLHALEEGRRKMGPFKVSEKVHKYLPSDDPDTWKLDQLFTELDNKYPRFSAEFNDEAVDPESLDRVTLRQAVEKAAMRAADAKAIEVGLKSIKPFRREPLEHRIDRYAPPDSDSSTWELDRLFQELSVSDPARYPNEVGERLVEAEKARLDHATLREAATKVAVGSYESREREFGLHGLGEFRAQDVSDLLDKYAWAKVDPSGWNLDKLFRELSARYPAFPVEVGYLSGSLDKADREANAAALQAVAKQAYDAHVVELGPEQVGDYEEAAVATLTDQYLQVEEEGEESQPNLSWLFLRLSSLYPVFPVVASRSFLDGQLDRAALERVVIQAAERAHQARVKELFDQLQRDVILNMFDQHWREHLYEMEYLREGIGLRAIGQRDPLVEYQREGFDMFEAMLEAIEHDAVTYIFNASPEAVKEGEEQRRMASRQRLQLSSALNKGDSAATTQQPPDKLPGRNDPCWCGSDLKFKKCHGRTSNQGATRRI
jgi:preprotein translocase subunit SecA